ncbi:polysaccharide biosynthesis/export family protein [Confluentibacter flavum]|uniref:Sugar transporter n=1 Tax=Confluentibacter flavum TaxID=1909700 RepID=A0A2N3HGF9_9FLAO|nr:polysaccharide biosynthesis/export family protein [Confluentibacter flavum]PKQ44056.1 sugar transporter [Confluentibacter flavum]
MRILNSLKTLRACTIIVLALFLTSCASKKEVVYFQNAKDFETIVNTDTFASRFKINDIVSINVSTFNLEAVRPFNLIKNAGSENGRVEELDYLIDNEGNIDYPVLGKIKLLGLTVEEAKQLFKEKLNDYLSDPIINIRILNFRVTILGEVGKPGTYAVSGERSSILEAIGLAGDLTIKGRRDNVMVIRDFNGTKTYTRIDLTTKEAFNSPVYFLTQNDVVYIEPNQSAISASSFDTRVSVAISIASILITSTVILLTRR